MGCAACPGTGGGTVGAVKERGGLICWGRWGSEGIDVGEGRGVEECSWGGGVCGFGRRDGYSVVITGGVVG